MSTVTETKSAAQATTQVAAAGVRSSQSYSRRPIWRLPLELSLFAMCGAAALELFFGACGVGMEEILQPDAALGTRHIPGKHVVWRMEGFSDGHLNSVGMRDREHQITKPPAVFRVALLGDSATEGLQVSANQTYAAYLEQHFKKRGINAEILNFGCSGYSTGQEVLQYEREAAQYKPDLTILLYNRGDATENIRKPWDVKVEPRPYFYLNEKGELLEDDAVLRAHRNSLQQPPIMQLLRSQSCLYGVFSHANLNLSMNEPLFRKLRGYMSFGENKRLTREGKQTCSYAAQDNCLVTAALISRLHRDCRQSGSKLLVLVFPNVNGDKEYSRQIPAVEKVARTEGFGFLDLTPSFHFYPDPMSLFVKFHFSDMGHLFVADRIMESLDGSPTGTINSLKPVAPKRRE